MVKCGFTHPPAGAHAVLYASGKYNFAFYALVVFSTAVSVIPATLVNNLSSKRQYPTYWGFDTPGWIKDFWAVKNFYI
jgi:CBS-domain-containing membrane protein